MPQTRARGLRWLIWPLGAAALLLCAWALTQSSHAEQARGEDSPWTALAHGKRDDAAALAAARPADDAVGAAVRGRLAIDRGQYDEAVRLLEPAAAKDPVGDAALELGLLHLRLGRAEAGTRLLSSLYNQSGSGEPRGAMRAARAAQALGRARDANSLFRVASNGGPDPAIDTAWGLLFVEKYNNAEALKSFQQALNGDPQWAPAHAGMARALAEENPPAAAAAAERALAIDAQLADAHLLLAELAIDNTRYDEARKHIDAVLAFNPSHLDARALVGGIAYVRDDRAAFDAELRRILAVNPAYGEAYRMAGDLAARHYRFEEAVALARQAVALDPTHARAHADLGMHLMRTGHEAEARRALDRAFRADPFDVVTYNLLALLDTLEKFVEFKEGDIVLKLHPDEAAVMREYAMPLAQEALKTLSARYNFKPQGPILVEIFPQHDDFAVRTLGLPGMIGALGACFGQVVIMDSPRARPPGSFSWQATLWHEMAHVITLQMSKQRVPRWLTEGISVYEETRARPEWGRDMEVPFAIALEQDKGLKLEDLNAGFTRPDTIALAYYQASLLVDHIVKTHGEAKLQALVRAYGEGVEGDAAVQQALGQPLAGLQGSFDKALDARFGPLRAALRDPRGSAPAAADLTTLRTAAEANPQSYKAQLALGQALAAEGDRAAFAPLEQAAALVPMAIGDDSPHAIMARLAEKLGETERAIREYQALLAQDHTAVEPARRLAALAEKAAAPAVVAMASERVIAIDPFDAQGHTMLGRYALKNNDAETAMREFRAALAIGPADKASAHCDLGESYLLAGRLAEAKQEALAALEIAPTFERAQELLLKSIKTSGAGEGRR
jgi:tetratricopeptide (TPR) repeat protein